MSDIFREVDEALQREKAEKFWKDYGPTLLLAAVLLVVGTAIGVAWRGWNHSRDEAETAKLVQALDSKEPAAQLQSLIGESRDGVDAVAQMVAAQALIDKEDKTGASALYKAVAENRSTPKDLRDLSRILYVRTAPDADAAQKRAVLEPVLQNDRSPFVWQARIEAALVEAGDNQYGKALAYLAPFQDQQDTLPASLYDRAMALSQLYAAKTGEGDKQ